MGDSLERKAPSKLLLALGMFSIQLTNVGYNVVAKMAVGSKEAGVEPLVFSFLRDALAFPLLLAMALFWDGRRLPHATDIPRFLMLGMTGMFGNQFLFILGLKFTDETIATVTTRFQPVFGALIAMTIGLEKFYWVKLASIVIAVGGALLMCAEMFIDGPHKKAGTNANSVAGMICLLGGALSMALFYVLQKPIVKKYPAVSITAWSYFSGAVCMGLACLYYVPWTDSWANDVCRAASSGRTTTMTPTINTTVGPTTTFNSYVPITKVPINSRDGGIFFKTTLDASGYELCSSLWRLSSTSWMAVGFAVLLNSIVKYLLITICNKHASVTQIMMWGTLVPLLGAIADPIFFKNAEGKPNYLTPTYAYVGIVPIMLGLIMMELANNRHKHDVVTIAPWQRPLLKLFCGEEIVVEREQLAAATHSEAEGLLGINNPEA